jgi:hypothetical protein
LNNDVIAPVFLPYIQLNSPTAVHLSLTEGKDKN